ncbi:MAG: exodeoxyribonuclease VII small subunit [Phycisphaerales bacterium]|jgi:exodeoxyribonuclease VII small subunit|nr:exodeoxyribonuclease VII small subunit [Phycisphaerales bacterium]
MSSSKPKKGDEPTYAAATAELEQILADIESGDADLDVLAEKVERAAALLTVCRQRLAATETKVRKVTAEIAAALEAPAAGGDDDADEDGDAK